MTTIIKVNKDKLFSKLEKADYSYEEMIAFVKEVEA
jgi:hypothetical protein